MENERLQWRICRIRGLRFDSNVSADLVERRRAEALHEFQLVHRFERPFRAAVVVDVLREPGSDAGNLFEIGTGGAVQVGERR